MPPALLFGLPKEKVAVHGEPSLQLQAMVATVAPSGVSSGMLGLTGVSATVRGLCRGIAWVPQLEVAHTASEQPISHLLPFHLAVRNATKFHPAFNWLPDRLSAPL